jgi:hypothetical protein
VLQSVHLDAPDQQVFVGVDLDLDYLLPFANLTTMAVTHDLKNGRPTRDSAARSAPIDSVRATWEEYEFELGVAFSPFGWEWEGPNARRAASHESAYLRVTSSEPKSLSDYDKIIARLQDLLTISMDHPCAVRSIA